MLDEDERGKKNLGRQGEAWFCTESGLYALILKSNAPKPFCKKRSGNTMNFALWKVKVMVTFSKGKSRNCIGNYVEQKRPLVYKWAFFYFCLKN